MIKKLTFSAVLLTMFILISNSANAGFFSDNSHIDGNIDYLKNSLIKNLDAPEKIPEPSQNGEVTSGQTTLIQKSQIIKVIGKNSTVATYSVMATAYSSTPDQT